MINLHYNGCSHYVYDISKQLVYRCSSAINIDVYQIIKRDNNGTHFGTHLELILWFDIDDNTRHLILKSASTTAAKFKKTDFINIMVEKTNMKIINDLLHEI